MTDKRITSLTDAENELLATVRDEWIGIALSTGRMTDHERHTVRAAVHELYDVAGLQPPKAVVIVPSPLVMALAGGRAAWWWYQRNHTPDATADAVLAATDTTIDVTTVSATVGATNVATRSATDDAVLAATNVATLDATLSATFTATIDTTAAATDAATLAVTNLATRSAMDTAVLTAMVDSATDGAANGATLATTFTATFTATRAATTDAVLTATDDAVFAATNVASFDAQAARCAARWTANYQGGNMWAAWAAYTDYWSRVMPQHRPELAHIYAKAACWLKLARISGFRYVHQDFCLVSEKPIRLLTENVDGRYVPHCADGPSHLWSDGFAIYHWHGVRVPSWVIEHKDQITLQKIQDESNAEVARSMREIHGEP
jgi:hypothetical protein